MTARLALTAAIVLAAACLVVAARAWPSALAAQPWNASTGTFLQAALALSLVAALAGRGSCAVRVWIGALACATLVAGANAVLLALLQPALERHRLLVAALDGLVWGSACAVGAILAWSGRPAGLAGQLAMLALVHSFGLLLLQVQYGREAFLDAGSAGLRAAVAAGVIIALARVRNRRKPAGGRDAAR